MSETLETSFETSSLDSRFETSFETSFETLPGDVVDVIFAKMPLMHTAALDCVNVTCRQSVQRLKDGSRLKPRWKSQKAWETPRIKPGHYAPHWDGDLVIEPLQFHVEVRPGDDLLAKVGRCPSGGSVLLHPGTYLIETPLCLERDMIYLFGRGQATIVCRDYTCESDAIRARIELHLLLVDHVRKFLSADLITRIESLRAAVQPVLDAVRAKVSRARLACRAVVTDPDYQFLLEFDDLNDCVGDLLNGRFHEPHFKPADDFPLTYAPDESGTVFVRDEQKTRLSMGYLDGAAMAEEGLEDVVLAAIQQALDTGTFESLVALCDIDTIAVNEHFETLTSQLDEMATSLRSVGTDAATECLARVTQFSARIVPMRDAIQPKRVKIQEAADAKRMAAAAAAAAEQKPKRARRS